MKRIILAAAIAVSLVGCASVRPSANAVSDPVTVAPPNPTFAAMRAWSTAHSAAVVGLSEDETAASEAATADDILRVQAACVQLERDATALLSVPPVPDPVVNAPWQRALSLLVAASTDCDEGIRNDSAALIEQASGEMDAASADLKQANAAISADLS